MGDLAMPRYVTRALIWIEDEVADTARADPRSITVHEREQRTADTGLVDSTGVPIYRVADRVPMGFRKG
jgi:hypothetical protein